MANDKQPHEQTTRRLTMKQGLVLEGGGLRSLFSEGVFDVLLENGVSFDGMIGVSAGASIGCNFKSRQIGRALRYNTNFAHDWRYVSLRSWLTTGDLIGAHFSYHVLPIKHDLFDFKTWSENPIRFIAVATDVDSGEPVYKDCADYLLSTQQRPNFSEDGVLDETPELFELLEWLRASSSMPIVSRPVQIKGRRLLDGGIADSIPLQRMQQLGYERNLVILTQPKGYFKPKTKLAPLFRLFCSPAIARAMACRHEMYNAQLRYVAEQESLGRCLVIAPERPLPIGRVEMKPEKMLQVYEMGRRAAQSSLQAIKAFLNQ